MNLYVLFMYFFIYSILGWIAEVIYCRIVGGKLTNRGFLNGPYCPIYGFGSLIIVLSLQYYINSPILVFFIGMILTTILEYITSFFMEKIFNARWWDYSNMQFNINGRVCLLNSLEFAILGLLLTYIIHPQIKQLIEKIPQNYIPVISISLFVIITLDFAVTLYTIFNLKERLNKLHEITEQIFENKKKDFQNIDIIQNLEKVKEDIISKTSLLNNRIIKAFPEIEFKKRNEQLLEIKSKLQNKLYNKKSHKKD